MVKVVFFVYFVCLFLCYLAVSFVQINLNPFEWPVAARVFLVIIPVSITFAISINIKD